MFWGTSWVSASATLTMPRRRISSPSMDVIGFDAVTFGAWMRVPVTRTPSSSSTSSSSSASAPNDSDVNPINAEAPKQAATDARTSSADVFLDTVIPPEVIPMLQARPGDFSRPPRTNAGGEYLEITRREFDADGSNRWTIGQTRLSRAGICPMLLCRFSLRYRFDLLLFLQQRAYCTRCRTNTTGCAIGTPLSVSCTVSVSGAPGVTLKTTGEVGRLSSCEAVPGNLPRKPGAMRGVVGPMPSPLAALFFGA